MWGFPIRTPRATGRGHNLGKANTYREEEGKNYKRTNNGGSVQKTYSKRKANTIRHNYTVLFTNTMAYARRALVYQTPLGSYAPHGRVPTTGVKRKNCAHRAGCK